MECYNCGYSLPADAERCPRCGQRFKPREQEAQATGGSRPSLWDRLKRLVGKSG
jgi:predicted amidophosphoribosyltransferase